MKRKHNDEFKREAGRMAFHFMVHATSQAVAAMCACATPKVMRSRKL